MSFYNTNTNYSPSFNQLSPPLPQQQQQQQFSGHLSSPMKRNNTFKSKLKSLKNELHEAMTLTTITTTTTTTKPPLLPWSRPPTRSNSTSSYRSPFSSIKLSNGNNTGKSSGFSSCQTSPQSLSLSSTKNDNNNNNNNNGIITDVFQASRSRSISLPISKFKSPTTIIATVTNSSTTTTNTTNTNSPCSISYTSLDYDYDYDNLFEFNSQTSSYDPNFKNEKLTTNTIDDLGKEEKFLLPPLPSSATTLTPKISSPGKLDNNNNNNNNQLDKNEMDKQQIDLLLPSTPSNNNSKKYQNITSSQQLLSYENNHNHSNLIDFDNNNTKNDEELVAVDRLACSILSLVGKNTNNQNIEWNI